MSAGYNLPDDFSWREFDEYNGRYEDDDEREEDEERHPQGCICADCSDAELTAEND